MADIDQARPQDRKPDSRTQPQTTAEDLSMELSFFSNPSQPGCPKTGCSESNEISKTLSSERIIFLPKTPEVNPQLTIPEEVKRPPISSHSNTDSPSLLKMSENLSLPLSGSDSPSIIKIHNPEISTLSTPKTTNGDAGIETGTTKSPNLNRSGPLLKWEPDELLRLRSWITCVCLIDFDLSLGQTMKFAYPSGSLSEAEGQNVASLAFPDSHSSVVGNYNFCFRFRTSGPSDSGMSYPYLFGYVFFCQKPDSTINRGYFQKSIVLVSHLPYTHLFLRVVEIIGPLFFEYGHSILEACCQNISQWPCPTKGGKFTFPILGELVRTTLQPHNSPPYSHPVQALKSPRPSQLIYPKHKNTSIKDTHLQNFTRMLAMGFTADVAMNALEKSGNDMEKAKAIATSDAELKEPYRKNRLHDGIDLIDLYNPASCLENPGGVFQDVNIYDVFRNVLSNLWFLWECAITGQPIMVISQSPEVCTRAVLGVMSMIAPLIYAGDFRPYFTVYDPDFKHFQERDENDTLGCVILGVTNPFFLKVYQCWSNVLHLSHLDGDEDDGKASPVESCAVDKKPVEVWQQASEHMRKPTLEKSKKRKEFEYNSKVNKMVSRHSAHLEPDRRILRRLMIAKRASEARMQISKINTAILRRHFREMTDNFLRPFFVYLTYDTKTLNGPDFNPYLDQISLRDFKENSFLEEVRKAPRDYFKNIPIKGKRWSLIKLYSRFLKSPHFPPWFDRKRDLVKAKLTKELNAAIKRVKPENLIEGQTMDNGRIMLGEIKRRIKLNQNNIELKKILNYHLKIVKRAIPQQELKQIAKASGEVLNQKLKLSSGKKQTSTTRDRNPKPNIMSMQHQLDFSLQEQYFRKPSL